ncbi:HD-GYP domain-containing protein [Botrimarina mediterranea]|uniref:HD-GYP domain-containing protein n=1 Tax=Botrimarina mediterranea TaxID=2528022 RepID=UPI00118A3137|nr:Cyclic di-GMP phosphodiesterase response regulator RpfG [Planctomycetes bacterium K2D]
MTQTTAQAPALRRLSKDEKGLVEHLTEATGGPIEVFCADDAAIDGNDRCTWFLDDQAAEPAPTDYHDLAVVPTSLLIQAAESDHACLDVVGDESMVAMRLNRQGDRVAVARGTQEEGELLRRLFATAAALHRSGDSARNLSTENELFAAQLSSDLEELSFLRSMVESLTSGRSNDNLTSLAHATLPVLNTTVRACCMAFMNLPDPSDPYRADAGVVIGSTPVNSASLSIAVQRYGPAALRGPVVKNWDTTNLPNAATLWDSSELIPGVRSLVIVPLNSGERMLGWLVAVNREPSLDPIPQKSWQLASEEFGSGEATLMATTASILATHAANLELVREKERLMVSMVRSLVSAIESKDQYTRGHSERVALFTRRLAHQIGYDGKALENIYLSALLHDVGKIGVSDAVLQKEGKLTEEEYAEIARHPNEGWAILCDIEHLEGILPGVLHHHERWDGRGYPDGLHGLEIPLDGRIMAVADAYDAMTSDRPYRAGMPSEKAEAILLEGAGKQWDPSCVEAFIGCIGDIRRIKSEYRLRDRKCRAPLRNQNEKLVHEVTGAMYLLPPRD